MGHSWWQADWPLSDGSRINRTFVQHLNKTPCSPVRTWSVANGCDDYATCVCTYMSRIVIVPFSVSAVANRAMTALRTTGRLLRWLGRAVSLAQATYTASSAIQQIEKMSEPVFARKVEWMTVKGRARSTPEKGY